MSSSSSSSSCGSSSNSSLVVVVVVVVVVLVVVVVVILANMQTIISIFVNAAKQIYKFQWPFKHSYYDLSKNKVMTE